MEGETSVTVKKFDDLFTENNQKTAFKIDIEGNELEALIGMQIYLQNNQCILQIEAFKNTKDELIKEMKNTGYNLIHSIGNDYYFSNF